MQVTIEAAYAEACQALGEAVVRERLLTAEVQRLSEQQQDKGSPAAQQEQG